MVRLASNSRAQEKHQNHCGGIAHVGARSQPCPLQGSADILYARGPRMWVTSQASGQKPEQEKTCH